MKSQSNVSLTNSGYSQEQATLWYQRFAKHVKKDWAVQSLIDGEWCWSKVLNIKADKEEVLGVLLHDLNNSKWLRKGSTHSISLKKIKTHIENDIVNVHCEDSSKGKVILHYKNMGFDKVVFF
ncbi:MAG TPA: hypothetical protein PK784_05520 [Tenuifilaceae bacterium]|nr:hypothetical protein [Tenuifilaceae bacterium]HPN21587.1 hypothetical protein [Tenuifilaceae bacterium]